MNIVKMEVHSQVITQNASKYIQTMCRHFAHKVPTELEETHGAIHFAMGVCELTAERGKLRVTCRAESSTELEEVAECVRDHFVRFAVREQLTLQWSPGAAACC